MELLNFLNSKGIGKLSSTHVSFSLLDKLNLTLLAMRSGCDLGFLSSRLNWKDFEIFTTLILERTAYTCQTNIHVVKPRAQIDVVAISTGVALIIDCKHWKAMSTKKMIECASQQRKRAKIYMKNQKKLNVGIPLIVTLYDSSQPLINKVPIVSIGRLRSFLMNYLLYENELLQVS